MNVTRRYGVRVGDVRVHVTEADRARILAACDRAARERRATAWWAGSAIVVGTVAGLLAAAVLLRVAGVA